MANNKVKLKDIQYAFDYTRGYRLKMILGVVAVLAISLLDSAVLPTINSVVTGISHDKPMPGWLVPGFIGFALLRSFFGYASLRLIYNSSQAAVNNIRQSVYTKCITISFEKWSQYSSAQINSLVTYNTEQIQKTYHSLMRTAILNVSSIAFALGYMFYISPTLFIITGFVTPIVMLAIKYFGRKCHQRAYDSAVAVSALTRYFDLSYQHISTIRMDGAGKFMEGGFENRSQNVFYHAKQYTHVSAMMHVFMMIAISTPIIAIFALYQYSFINITAGVVTVFIIGMMRCLPLVRQLAQISSDLYRGLASLAHIKEFLGQPDESERGLSCPISTDIVFSGVSFAYSDKPVLHHLNATFGKGLHAIVGRSGSGKSTLLHLVSRLYQYDGLITLGGVNICDVALPEYRQCVSFLSQKCAVFDGSVRENIVMRTGDLDQERYDDALRRSGFITVIDELEQGDMTILGPGQMQLSGGQMQRLALARALYKNSKILLLDEPTSAIDHSQSHQIISDLHQIAQDACVIVVTHDVSLLAHMDTVSLMLSGQVVSQGLHRDLWENSDVYRHELSSESLL